MQTVFSLEYSKINAEYQKIDKKRGGKKKVI